MEGKQAKRRVFVPSRRYAEGTNIPTVVHHWEWTPAKGVWFVSHPAAGSYRCKSDYTLPELLKTEKPVEVLPCNRCGEIPPIEAGAGISCRNCYDGAPDSATRGECAQWEGTLGRTVNAWRGVVEEDQDNL